MISIEDQKRMIESKGCESCPNWLKYCQAECCKISYILISPENLNDDFESLVLGCELSDDEIWYWDLRGVKYENGNLIFERKYCFGAGDKIAYVRTCDKLSKDNRCTGHPNNKPLLCINMNYENVLSGDTSVVVTPNCLFKYKKMEKEVESNGK